MTTQRKIRLGVLFTALILMTVVILQNTDPVSIQLLLAQATIPLALLLALTFILGISCGFIFAFVLINKRKNSTAKS